MNRCRLRTLLVIIVTLATACFVQAQTKPGPSDSARLPAADLTRIKVGDEAPDFTLEDQDSRLVALSSYRGAKSVVLVFYRGYW